MPNKLLFRLITFLIVLLNIHPAFSQTLINSTGNSIQNNSISVEYSIGEIGIATLSSNQNYITEGLLQPVFKFKECNLLQNMPNAFTPNNDNINDCFGVKDWPAASSYELRVYNRWGQLVFKTTNSLECWNGDFNGQPQPTDAYVYIINANTSACGQTTVKGSFILIR